MPNDLYGSPRAASGRDGAPLQLWERYQLADDDGMPLDECGELLKIRAATAQNPVHGTPGALWAVDRFGRRERLTAASLTDRPLGAPPPSLGAFGSAGGERTRRPREIGRRPARHSR